MTMSQIDPAQTIGQILRDHCEFGLVLQRHEIPPASVEQLTLDRLCDDRGLDREAVVRELEQVETQHGLQAGCFEWELETGVIRGTPDLCRLYGLKPGEFPSTLPELLARVIPEDRGRIQAVVAEVLAHPKAFTYEHRIERDGHVRILYTRADVISRPGEKARVVGTCWDVTERQGDGSIEGVASLLQGTLEATIDGILVVDRAGTITTSNQRFLALWNIPHALVGEGSDDALLGYVLDQLEDPAAFLQRVRELYANPERESFDVVRFKSGRVLERYSRPQRVDQAIVGRVWSFRDVTERERLLGRQALLVDASRLLGSLDAESALEAVMRRAVPYLGDACAIQFTMEVGAPRIVGYSLDPALTVPLEIPSMTRSQTAMLYDVNSSPRLAVWLEARERSMGVMVFALSTHRRRYYTRADIEVAEELADRVALALDNARLYREAQSALRARDEFLSIAAHEIRGPLASIHLAAEALQSELPAETRERMLALVVREDRRLARFVDDLVDLGSIRTGQLSLEYDTVNLADVVAGVRARLARDLERSGSSLEIVGDLAVTGRWDRFRIDQVVTNLVGNAVKFGLGKPIEVRISSSDGSATLMVIDHGLGVLEDQRERIFRPFERGVSVRHYGGLGLGLYIARTILTLLGGTITVEPEPGGGSRFTVTLPKGALR
jgi:signal transduction histidine kinase